ncbi:WD40 repeat-like protein [Rhizopogon salebrosus TDB-379]|nr:WD40 repeat-like protein [Rhizopogon salebrosus TDB-379]
MTLRGHQGYISSLDYFPDGKRMISGSRDKTSRQWDLQAGMELEEVRDTCDDEVDVVAVSRDGQWVITTTSDYDGASWNLDTGKFVAGPLSTGASRVSAVRFSQDSKKLAVSMYGDCLEVWDFHASTLEPVGAPFERHIKVIFGLALSFDGALLASASDNTIKFWAFESRQLLASFHVTDTYHLILSPTISTQLAYVTYPRPYGPGDDYEIAICNIPPDILSNIGTAQGQSALPKVRIYSCLPCSIQ